MVCDELLQLSYTHLSYPQLENGQTAEGLLSPCREGRSRPSYCNGQQIID